MASEHVDVSTTLGHVRNWAIGLQTSCDVHMLTPTGVASFGLGASTPRSPPFSTSCASEFGRVSLRPAFSAHRARLCRHWAVLFLGSPPKGGGEGNQRRTNHSEGSPILGQTRMCDKVLERPAESADQNAIVWSDSDIRQPPGFNLDALH